MKGKRFIVDAHLDLAMNAIEWNRDLTQDVYAIRAREQGMTDKLDRGKGTVSLPALRAGNIGLVVATQIARYVEVGSPLPGYHSPEIAWGITQAQLAWYQAMVHKGEMRMITDLEGLDRHLALWEEEDESSGKVKPVGFVLSLEGADSLVDLSYLHKAYAYGLRVCGPAHYGPGRYAAGTGREEGFTAIGLELLKEMDSLNMILDITHLTDRGFSEAMDLYQGNMWASHHNCRSLVAHQRQLSDEQIKTLLERDAVIGVAFDTWMLVDNWVRGTDDPKERNVHTALVADHIDHVCQLAGNTKHAAIGTDLDGAYGKEQSPYDLDTIADIQMLEDILTKRGYSEDDLNRVFHQNWIDFLRRAWRK